MRTGDTTTTIGAREECGAAVEAVIAPAAPAADAPAAVEAVIAPAAPAAADAGIAPAAATAPRTRHRKKKAGSASAAAAPAAVEAVIAPAVGAAADAGIAPAADAAAQAAVAAGIAPAAAAATTSRRRRTNGNDSRCFIIPYSMEVIPYLEVDPRRCELRTAAAQAAIAAVAGRARRHDSKGCVVDAPAAPARGKNANDPTAGLPGDKLGVPAVNDLRPW